MPLSINTNLMAGNTARTLGVHYNRLSTSVRRLASGLRVNSAADDAAGLAIRELMRADVAALNQGVRNANDAISMIQVADGALAVIDEKLIRMKELAEQAATGTYTSTQRLMIHSEYQAMAAEIDRIANATDFNGIKLLDGSLSGTHNGSGLTSTGAMKIHFGTGNDSAEDYYYVEIGACTTAALGLSGGIIEIPPQITYIKQETYGPIIETFKPSLSYDEYKSPNGTTFYKDGKYYFSDLRDPVGSRLTNPNIIASLYTEQETKRTSYHYIVYVDPVTNMEYYTTTNSYDPKRNSYTTDPYDPIGKRLNPGKAEDKEIIERLEKSPSNKHVDVDIVWHLYKDNNGKIYYSYNNGMTFIPDTSSPGSDILDSADPDDKAIIDNFEIVPGTTNIDLPWVTYRYDTYSVPGSTVYYYSRDGGKTFVKNASHPDTTQLDPVKDRELISKLQLVMDWKSPRGYPAYKLLRQFSQNDACTSKRD